MIVLTSIGRVNKGDFCSAEWAAFDIVSSTERCNLKEVVYLQASRHGIGGV